MNIIFFVILFSERHITRFTMLYTFLVLYNIHYNDKTIKTGYMKIKIKCHPRYYELDKSRELKSIKKYLDHKYANCGYRIISIEDHSTVQDIPLEIELDGVTYKVSDVLDPIELDDEVFWDTHTFLVSYDVLSHFGGEFVREYKETKIKCSLESYEMDKSRGWNSIKKYLENRIYYRKPVIKSIEERKDIPTQIEVDGVTYNVDPAFTYHCLQHKDFMDHYTFLIRYTEYNDYHYSSSEIKYGKVIVRCSHKNYLMDKQQGWTGLKRLLASNMSFCQNCEVYSMAEREIVPETIDTVDEIHKVNNIERIFEFCDGYFEVIKKYYR